MNIMRRKIGVSLLGLMVLVYLFWPHKVTSGSSTLLPGGSMTRRFTQVNNAEGGGLSPVVDQEVNPTVRGRGLTQDESASWVDLSAKFPDILAAASHQHATHQGNISFTTGDLSLTTSNLQITSNSVLEQSPGTDSMTPNQTNLLTQDITSKLASNNLTQIQAAALLNADSTNSFLLTTGGSDTDAAADVEVTSDGGYIVVGKTYSFSAGEADIFLLKYQSDGSLSWARSFGSVDNSEVAYDISLTADNGYIITGNTYISGESHYDVLLLKIDSSGALSWGVTVGGSGNDYAYAVQPTSDDGYIVAGYTDSFGVGEDDVLLLKFEDDGNLSWAKTTGRADEDYAYSLDVTSDNGYLISGVTVIKGDGFYDTYALLLKFDSSGNLSWVKRIGTGDERGRSAMQTRDGGYIMTGSTVFDGYGDLVLLCKFDSTGVLTWCSRVSGGPFDSGRDVKQTADGGYILAGSTSNFGRAGDIFLIKFDQGGSLSWARVIGGWDEDFPYSVSQTPDGGYILAGQTTGLESGEVDIILVKTNPQGDIEECDLCRAVSPGFSHISPPVDTPTFFSGSHSITPQTPTIYTGYPTPEVLYPCGIPFMAAVGGPGIDGGSSVEATRDGGYAVAGYTYSYGAGSRDAFLVKFDRIGRLSWAKTVGGTGYETIYDLAQTTDDGYILAGRTSSFGAGLADVLLLKFDGAGNLSWARTAGGTGNDYAFAVDQTSDGGYVIAGSTTSYGEGGQDVLLLKYDSTGSLQWTKVAGYEGDESLFSVEQTTDGGYVAAGWTNSFSSLDILLIKFTSFGGFDWAQQIGLFEASGSEVSEFAYGVIQNSFGGYVLVGGIDVVGSGGDDIFIIKTDASGIPRNIRVIGGSYDDSARSIQETKDYDYIVAGTTSSYGAGGEDFILLKLNSSLDIDWVRTIGGSGNETAYGLDIALDRGYIIAGETYSFGAGSRDLLVVKTDYKGEIADCPSCAAVSPNWSNSVTGFGGTTPTFDNPNPEVGNPDLTVANQTPSRELVCGKRFFGYFPLVLGPGLCSPCP